MGPKLHKIFQAPSGKAFHPKAVSLALFVIIFAGVGSYFLFFSHAATLTGDINGDGIVNVMDLSLLLSSYGKNQSGCVTNSNYTCDLNGDGVINIYDLSILLGNYGKSQSAGNLQFSGLTSGQTVSGGLIASVDTSSLSGVAKVDYLFDGKVVRSETAPPFCIGGDNGSTCLAWDSTTVANGVHSWQFIVYDASGNVIGQTPVVSFTVDNTTASGQLLWKADATRPISQEWASYSFADNCGGSTSSSQGSSRFSQESSVVPPGKTKAYHFLLYDGDSCYSTERGEINDGNPPLSGGFMGGDNYDHWMYQGQERWMAYWYYIPSSSVMGPSFPWHTILQWHNPATGGPPLSVDAFDNNNTLSVNVQDCQTMGCAQGSQIWTGTYPRDKWFKLLLHVKWSSSSDGFIELYGDLDDGQGFHQLMPRYNRWNLKVDSSGNPGPVFATIGNYRNASFTGTSELYEDGPFVGTSEEGVTQAAFGF